MYERVVENWLVKANERQYQRPFCQVLASEGETIHYVSRHGAAELGKDIATVTPDGVARGYQLKCGDIGLSQLREIWGELEELVTLDFNYPQLHTTGSHESYLVTNGELKDPALGRIKEANLTWAKKGLGPLRVIQRDMLLSQFNTAHGRFFPKELSDLNKFLELYVHDGRKPLDKPNYCSLLASLADLEQSAKASLDITRRAGSLTIISSYLDLGPDGAGNHWKRFESWVITGATILALSLKNGASGFNYSFSLACEAAFDALEALTLESLANEANLHLWSPFSEGYIYAYRLTLICALMATRLIALRLKGTPAVNEGEVIEFLRRNLRKCKLAGETYIVYTVLTCLALELRGAHRLAQERIYAAFRYNVEANGGEGRGIPNTYYGPEQSLHLLLGRNRNNSEVFTKESYTLETLIIYLARRMNRQALKASWYEATGVNMLSFFPSSEWQWFCWRSEEGELRDRPLNRPESWKNLHDRACQEPESLPTVFSEAPWFAALFAMVYPHRWNAELFKLVDSVLVGPS